jgi:hypothetical protein
MAPSSSSLEGAIPYGLQKTAPAVSNIPNQSPQLSIFTDSTSTALVNGHSPEGPLSVTTPLQPATPTLLAESSPAAMDVNNPPTPIDTSSNQAVGFGISLSRHDSQTSKRTVDDSNLGHHNDDDDANKRLRMDVDEKPHSIDTQQESVPQEGSEDEESDEEVMEVDKDGLVPAEFCVAAIFDQEENQAGERPCRLCR